MERDIRIVLADDHPVVRIGVRNMLTDTEGFEVVGEASDGDEAITLTLESQPDILLLDLHMPQKRDLPAPMVKSQLNCIEYTLAISFANDEEAKSLAASYGAVALLDKMGLYTELLPAIMRLADPSANPSFKIDSRPSREGMSLGLPE